MSKRKKTTELPPISQPSKKPRASTTAKAPVKKGKPPPATPSTGSKLARARKAQTTATKSGGKAPATVKGYEGEWNRFVKWVDELADDEEKLESSWEDHKGLLGFDEDEDAGEDSSPFEERMPTPQEIRAAISGDPTELTPYLVSWFMAHKCYDDECGAATADLINASITDRYKYRCVACFLVLLLLLLKPADRRGDAFRGPWHQDAYTRKWRGNPCQAAIVVDTYHGCKVKDGEAQRRHSVPYKIEGMRQVYEMFQKDCPKLKDIVDPATLAQYAELLEYMAYSTVTWNAWAR